MKKTKLPNIVAILILTLITAVMWVSFSIYRAFAVKPNAEVPEEISKPLSPTLDIDTINTIESRLFIDDSQIPQNVVTGPIQTATTVPVSTPAPTQEPNQEAQETQTPEPTP